MYRKFFKRFFDFFGAIFLIILTSPIMILVAILIKIKLGSPVIFTQERPGLDSKIFKIYKFRTMNNKKDKDGNLLPDELRLGTFGKKIRSLSLDELPQLFNVLKGDMSFIGPRPLLVEYLDIYTPHQLQRHCVRPGITGLAQTNGRNAISWKEKFEYDVKYVKSLSFKTDIKIAIDTIKVVFKRKDINKQGFDTTEKFNGNN
ncbi:N,N'-diacetylbacilliosaminyl-1-phosphate transferase [Campylobacter pinnipediorum subsp. pinnipediorum]|uniref:sugar transferase n=1 Tax=Campylobacter pinnipediorum TaxID=1965231 RepID=UPI000994DA62|nr:sugar transferase [Campylobacter pinnipediorum]AQW84455.1 N,N'-diacetylbacilliosaminyl-1-phosphate transferase [Campylobacter pinnipediorum subsp. pinnipediorum]